MRTSTAIIVGSIAGGLILIVAAIAFHAVNWVKRETAIKAVEIVESKAPSYHEALDVCRELAESRVGCMNFHHVSRVNGEIEAASVIVGGVTSRISIYSSRAVVDTVIDTSLGRNAFGQPIDLVAGDNWTLSVLPGRGAGHGLAYAARDVLGGLVIESKEG